MTITLIQRNQEVPVKRLTGYLSGTYTVETFTNALLTTTNAEANGFQVPGNYTAGVLGAAQTLKQNVVIAGDGTIVIYPGFQPKHVMVRSVTSGISKEWYEGMNVTDSLLTIAAGTRTLVTSSGLLISSPTPTGSAPVTVEVQPSVTIDCSVDTLIASSDTVVWEIEG
jgi:hypothetical protein